ncbi:MAG: DUF4177 domain-containing protein [Rhodobacterales bacterium]|nr:MAG: DUF4177 domain-containing protein [Rhodobacterales bacterium]
MPFEYIAKPAPTKGTKARGVRSSADRLALSVTNAINEMAAQGWQYLRVDTLPVEERSGLTGKVTTYQNLLIFQREIEVEVEEEAPLGLEDTRDDEEDARFEDAEDAEDNGDEDGDEKTVALEALAELRVTPKMAMPKLPGAVRED